MILIDPKKLLGPLRMACAAVSKNGAMPITNHLLVEYGGDMLKMTGSDLETTITASMPIETPIKGQVAIPAHKLLSIVDAAKDSDQIKINLAKEGQSNITAGRARFRLATLPGGDYPSPNTQDDAVIHLALPADDLRKILARTSAAQGVQDVRYYLNGTLLHLDGDTLRAVATNGHRMHIAETTISGDHQAQIIIPRQSVDACGKLPIDGVLSVTIGHGWITLDADGVSLHSRLIDGKFPEYNAVIPKGDYDLCKVSSADFLLALTRCAILGNHDSNAIRLDFSDDCIQMESCNTDGETAKNEIAAEYTGKCISIGANIRYLIDALRNVGAEHVAMRIPREGQCGVIIEPVDDTDRRAVVMQMKI